MIEIIVQPRTVLQYPFTIEPDEQLQDVVPVKPVIQLVQTDVEEQVSQPVM